MSCTKPLIAYESGHVNPSGKKRLVFNPAKSIDGKEIPLPCGQCVACRLTQSRDWAIRINCEASQNGIMGGNNMFLTLTYNQKSLPLDLSLQKSHFQKFIRALRDKYRKTNPIIRYFMCGEYGEATQENAFIARPHYHAIIFNFRFPDEKFLYEKHGNRVHTSAICNELWGRGDTEYGDVSMQSAAYVARYVLKKQNQHQSRQKDRETGLTHYQCIHPFTGDLCERIPEYTKMSLKPGIGSDWYKKFKKDIYPSGQMYLGHSPDAAKHSKPIYVKAPRYFDKLLERERPDMMEAVTEKRIQYAKDHAANFSFNRRQAKEKITAQRVEKLKRKLQ